MKTLMKAIPLLLVLVLLLGMPVAVLAQTPPPGGETYSGDHLVLGDNYTLSSGQVLNGSLVIIGGNATIETDAKVNGDIALLGGNLNFAGEVSGTISSLGGNVNLLSGAIVRGDIDSMGGNVSGTDQARIFGQVSTMSPRALMFNFDRFRIGTDNLPTPNPVRTFGRVVGDVLSNILQILAVAVLALVVALLLPKPLPRVAQPVSDHTLLSGGVGLLTMQVFPLALLIMMITIILIPVALIAILVAGIAFLFGWIAVGYVIGNRMAVLLKTEWADAVSAGLGTLVLGTIVWLLGYLFCLGGLVTLLAGSIGLGAIILSRFGTTTYTPGGSAPQPVAAVPPAPIAPVAPVTPVAQITPVPPVQPVSEPVITETPHESDQPKPTEPPGEQPPGEA